MKFLFKSADAYLRQSDWRDFALIKFCLFSMGLIAGVLLPHKAKKPAIITAAAVFVATYIPLMVKYGKIVVGMVKSAGQAEEYVGLSPYKGDSWDKDCLNLRRKCV